MSWKSLVLPRASSISEVAYKITAVSYRLFLHTEMQSLELISMYRHH
jgi:hypothetical protein